MIQLIKSLAVVAVPVSLVLAGAGCSGDGATRSEGPVSSTSEAVTTLSITGTVTGPSGALQGVTQIFPKDTFLAAIRTALSGKRAMVALNEQAFERGANLAAELADR